MGFVNTGQQILFVSCAIVGKVSIHMQGQEFHSNHVLTNEKYITIFHCDDAQYVLCNDPVFAHAVDMASTACVNTAVSFAFSYKPNTLYFDRMLSFILWYSPQEEKSSYFICFLSSILLVIHLLYFGSKLNSL